jgi:hypothetical protein
MLYIIQVSGMQYSELHMQEVSWLKLLSYRDPVEFTIAADIVRLIDSMTLRWFTTNSFIFSTLFFTALS